MTYRRRVLFVALLYNQATLLLQNLKLRRLDSKSRDNTNPYVISLSNAPLYMKMNAIEYQVMLYITQLFYHYPTIMI